MSVNGPEIDQDATLINRNPAVWQSNGAAYGLLRVMATPNDGIYQLFAGLSTLPDYYKFIKAETIDEAITFIKNWDKKIHDEIMAG